MEYNAAPALGELPGSLGSSQSAADNMNRTYLMSLHVLTIANRWPLTLVLGLSVSCSSSQASPEVSVPSSDEAWVASACDAVSVDTTGWRRHRIADITIQAPSQYTPSGSRGQTEHSRDLTLRGPGGSIQIIVDRNARYMYDDVNRARRGQNMCNGSLGGYQSEIISWFERFGSTPTDTRSGELVLGATYNFAARLPVSWGGPDAGKWLFVYVGASRIRDAYLLRDVLHTLAPVTRTP